MSKEIIIDAEIVEEKTEQIIEQAPLTGRQRTVQHLRDLANFLERHEEIRAPHIFPTGESYGQGYKQNVFDFFAKSAEEAADIVKAIGGRWDKRTSYDEQNMIFTGHFSDGEIGVQVWVSRELVCTPKVVGKKMVKKPTKTAYEEVEVDDIEYECGSLMSAAMQEKLAKIPAKEVSA